jgi:hypothetical protein
VKNVIIIVVMLALGSTGAWIYLKAQGKPGGEHGVATNRAAEQLLYADSAIQAAAPQCATHNIPDAICAFCHSDLIEGLGFCRGHNVPEAFCTRCSPVLIAAFKAENDWCAEHELPESQCLICQGATEGS